VTATTSIVCAAIHHRVRLVFEYGGRLRIVEPYCHGTSTAGTEVLRAVQVGGAGPSSGLGFGKLWSVSKMVNVRVEGPFEPNDPSYNRDDSAMRVIHCRV
jgi:hypothetical protein